MEDIREKICLHFINKLEKEGEIKDTREEGENNKWHIDDVTGSLNSLAANFKIVLEKYEIKKDQLTTEALVCIEKGSPEVRLWTLAGEQLLKKDLEEKLGGKEYATSGFSTSMGKKWISYNKQTDEITRAVKEQVKDELQEQVINYQNGKSSENDITQLKKRKYLKQVVIKTFKATKGPKFYVKDEDVMRTLTTELLLSGEWKNKLLKEPNLESLGQVPKHGSLHPLLKMRDTYRQILLELGFEEMPTNRFVESSFWNFDALFQPQQHPVRDAHDTFFLTDPKYANKLGEEKYVERVKDMHEKGGNGSIGWRYKWDLQESKKNIFRTHTTAISSNMLYQLAQEKEFTPKKYFSIDRVFRNETLDSTHLAEFHQIEGLIADYDLTIGDLMGIIGSFFEKVGIPKSNLKFKPAYNPYTEPSLEIFSFHRGLKKWVEIGNSGIFRPEMLLPMGLPENVKVIAWGLSVERPTMILYGIDNIRDLCGCDLDIKKIIQHPIVRIEKQQELSEEKAKKKN